jgi:hypothetical protein
VVSLLVIAPCCFESREGSQSAGGGPKRSESRVMGSDESLFAEEAFPMAFFFDS